AASMMGMPLTKADSKASSKLIDTTPSAAGDTGVFTFSPAHPSRNMHDNQMLEVRIQKLLEPAHAEFNVPDFHAEDHLISNQLIPKCDGIASVHALKRTQIRFNVLIVVMQNDQFRPLNFQGVDDLVLQNCGLIRNVIKLRLF